MITLLFLLICSIVLIFLQAREINREDPYYIKTAPVLLSTSLLGKLDPTSLLEKFWKHSFNFKGKIKRKEFWITQGFIFLLYLLSVSISICLFLDINYVGNSYDFEWTGVTTYIWISFYGFSLVCLIPSISIQVRRLRDAARNPWWILISFVPFVGGIVLLIFYLSPSRTKRLPMTLQDRLNEVEDLLTKGTIDEEEYKYMRKQILSKHIN